MTRIRSLLKYPGGKFALLNAIEENMPKDGFQIYAEPFFGGGSVGLNLGHKANRCLFNDGNSDVMGFWEVVRDNPMILLKKIIELGDDRGQDSYLSIRELFNDNMTKAHDKIFSAAMFYYLNREGFNGLIRYNSKGKWNVPYGKMKNFKLPEDEQLSYTTRILQRAKITCLDFQKFALNEIVPLSLSGARIFVYLDPPYIPLTKTASFTSYWKKFDLEEHKHLRIILDLLDEAGVQFLLSNSKTPETEEIFKGFNFTEVQAPRNISCKGEGRGSIGEYLIKNY